MYLVLNTHCPSSDWAPALCIVEIDRAYVAQLFKVVQIIKQLKASYPIEEIVLADYHSFFVANGDEEPIFAMPVVGEEHDLVEDKLDWGCGEGFAFIAELPRVEWAFTKVHQVVVSTSDVTFRACWNDTIVEAWVGMEILRQKYGEV